MCSAQHSRSGPTLIVATTRFVAGSMRETLGSQGVRDPDGVRRDGDPGRLTADGIVAITLFVSRVDARDRVLAGWVSQTRAVAGGGRLARIEL